MDPSAATLLHSPLPKELIDEKGGMIFDKHVLQQLEHIPKEYHWPSSDLVETSQEELNEPLIDIGVMMNGDEVSIAKAAELVRDACMKHGFFQVINHGVDQNLITEAYEGTKHIFNLPLSMKMVARNVRGELEGYSGAHVEKFSSKLPWKETFTWRYHHDDESESQVVEYFKSALGEEFQHIGLVFERYCKAMKELCLMIMELLAISLGVDRLHYRNYFLDGEQTMRLNSYPPCKENHLTLGNGPHTDPISLTLLHQDHVGGLEAFLDNKWLPVRPRPDAFVINLGDTFVALSNGRYKSCMHRTRINKENERFSMTCFVNSRVDKIVRPPETLFGEDEPRKYPDYVWSDLENFTQLHHRVDAANLESFFQWIRSSKSSN
ncbi:hypothetical protein TanjilG_02445 [Lupinus angustifolius]|uniref:Fe2OG dioxygenase domain-containing protein n=1 Tax=Lupinus angustifolius TaxID=3871 RepID=A0A1J7IRP0_LUPAN|nr:PREDICTED: gibberellin 20 oxidase 1-D-like [Lupinus angustifolius]OIW17817.1 hypothetical protein TanjilG_02445 [Lupinus angustifolius]